MSENIRPKKFVGLHSHSLSLGDSIGYPQDHIDYVLENGMDGLAITDHGTMSSYSHQYFYDKKLKDKGIKFKNIYGIEAYFLDSLQTWKELYNKQQNINTLKKAAKKGDTEAFKELELIGDPFAVAKTEMKENYSDESESGGVLENEEESKSNKFKDPLKQRNHLVLLAKNSEGLKSLFELVSKSYIDGYYFYPRIDFDMLKKYAKGNIVASSACLGGNLCKIIFDHQIEQDWEKWVPNDVNFELIQNKLKDQINKFQWALGEENFYLELQYNAINAQHLVNQHLIEASKRTSAKLITTVDAHYARPEHWRQREIYKMMAWASRGMSMNKDKLPKTIDELKCELYPKNADQVWESYKRYTKDKGWDFYDDKLVCESIERTWSIAHEQIDDPKPNTNVKLPSIKRIIETDKAKKFLEEAGDGIDEDKIAFAELKQQAIEGLKVRGYIDDQKYIERLKYELSVIKHLKFSKYFLTYSKIMKLVTKHQFTGPGRGSAAGALLSYVLNITQIDPVKYDLLFERFMTHKKKSYPDIDCLHEDTLVCTINVKFYTGIGDCVYKKIKDLEVDDFVLDWNMNPKKVLAVKKRKSNNEDKLLEFTVLCINDENNVETYGSFITTSKHKLIDHKRNIIPAEQIKIGSILHSYYETDLFIEDIKLINKKSHFNDIIVKDVKTLNQQINLVDITVEDSATFQFVPFDCCVVKSQNNNTNVVVNQYDYNNTININTFLKKINCKHISKIEVSSFLKKNILISSHNSDFADREQVLELISEYFGPGNIIPISNFNQLQLRSLIKDLCRLNGVPFEEINKYTRRIESEALTESKKTAGFDAQQWTLTYQEANEKSITFRELMKKYPNLEEDIQVLFKQLRVVSKHAGGVLISEQPECNMPLIYGKGKVLQTPWSEGLNYRHLEDLGFLKFDILGLGTLRMFENCIRRILKNQGNNYPTFEQINEWFYKNVHPDNNTMDDIKVYKHVYWKGNWAGIFQFVQPPVQNFVKKLKPISILDLAVATSVYRPGPLGISADKLYLKNRSNPEKIEYKHPLLKEVLGPTYGLIIFQEQLQLIYHKLAGVPLDETDDVRKAFTKKDKSNKEESEKIRHEMREDFAEKCLQVNNIEKQISYEIFDDVEKFISYSFNKSHATCYMVTSYMCAWLLTYYPDEWIASYIDYCATEKGHVSGKESPISIALGEAKNIGYNIGKPDINLSQEDYQVKNKVLIPSFRALKHVGLPALQEIKQYRPYKTIEDLILNPDETWKHSKFSKKAMSTLIKLEAFDSLDLVGENKPIKNYRQLYYILVEKGDELKRACTRKKSPRPKELLETLIIEAQSLPDWTVAEKIEHSETLAGSVDTNLIITPQIKSVLEEQNIGSLDQWINENEYLWFIIKNCKVAKTKNGKDYLRLQIFGESGSEQGCFVWGFSKDKHKLIENYTLCVARFKKSDFGLSTFYTGIKVLNTR